ncbi:MAG: DUF4838 domain-containing protein, partial [Clostridia bacterium]|nr:DUF4838 domain-containing protein [Clostridia bacterium]
WYYGANYNYFVSPSPNLFNFYDDVKYIAERGIIGMYAEGSSDPVRYSFEYLRSYLCSKILWDPYMTEEEYEDLMDEYLMLHYGKGWEYIKQYIYMSNYASDINGCWTNNHDAPWDVYSKDYFAEHYEEMARLFRQAYDAAESDDERERIVMTSVHMHFLGLSATYESNYVNGTEEQRNTYKERYAQLWKYYRDNAYDEDTNPTGIKGYVNGSGTAQFDNFPSLPNPVMCPMDWMFKGGFDGRSGTWTWEITT